MVEVDAARRVSEHVVRLANSDNLANSDDDAESRVFCSPVARVDVRTLPSILPDLRNHIYYDLGGADGVASWQVSGVVDAEFWGQFLPSVGSSWSSVIEHGDMGFVVDVEEGRRLIAIERSLTLVVVDYSERRVYVVSAGAPDLVAELCRTVRALHTFYALGSGGLTLNASSIERHGRVVCFVGDKGAGKTTSLLSCVTANMPGLRAVGDDIALVYGTHSPGVSSWPSSINAYPGSLVRVGLLDCIGTATHRTESHLAGEGSAGSLPSLPLSEGGASRRAIPGPSHVCLTPEDLRQSIGAQFTSGGGLSAILEVSLDLELETSEIYPMRDQGDKTELLQRNQCHADASCSDWLGLERSATHSGGEPSSEIDLAQVFCARLVLGADGHDVLRGIAYSLTSDNAREVWPLPSGLPLPKYHFGVYARIRRGDEVLLVRKTRGPYTGLFDLPGGRPEFGESMETALQRELEEELGVSTSTDVDFEHVLVHVVADSQGRAINFFHQGLVADVELDVNALDQSVVSEDTDGFVWVPLNTLTAENTSTFAREALKV